MEKKTLCLSVLLGFLLLFSACQENRRSANQRGIAQQEQTPSAQTPTVEKHRIEVPRTVDAPPPPPPPPPVYEEIPREEFMEEKELEFSNQSIERDLSIQAPPAPVPPKPSRRDNWDDGNTETYDHIVENDFQLVTDHALSTFSVDVDRASYANVRRMLSQGQLPPKGSVRIEEFINYFDYDYAQPDGEQPFSISTEMADCPWNMEHKLLHLGLQGKELAQGEVPPSNLVFLIDVSGSMQDNNKLPLLKNAFKLLVGQLDAKDRIAIVVYAGSSGLVLPATPGSEKEKIMQAINSLYPGGSTAGAEGIRLAYQIAQENFMAEGNNRIILATDGDFNIGVSSESGLVNLIEEKRNGGIFLSVLGFGTGNYKDATMEKLADKGNGNYAYIDNLFEAKKVLVNEFSGTLFTIAKDVKIQIEFNPAKVHAYRLIGYENRILKKEDFNDDTKDAGEIGAGHTVTALYEIIPVGANNTLAGKVDELKYQSVTTLPTAQQYPEWMTIKLRYKEPTGTVSKLLTLTVENRDLKWQKSSDNYRFSAAVAAFGMTLRDSQYKGTTDFNLISKLAISAKGDDREGYRAEFVRLTGLAEVLMPKEQMKSD
ncbi:MAG: hypothetical protein DHS20C18_04570 [Saprospiraceae bacterium]|nr:MAG: hypothetical protein DHS20C18_04570 [Saprospiraceae bacterium]